jgi:hypothetical protein
MQTRPISFLKLSFQLAKEHGMASKISRFLEVQMVQHPVIRISLKMLRPLPETACLPSARLFAESILSGTRQTACLLDAVQNTLGEKSDTRQTYFFVECQK